MSSRKRRKRIKLAVVVNPEDTEPPSTQRSLLRLATTARKNNFDLFLLTNHEFSLYHVTEFDAIFLRATTSPDNFTYAIACQAYEYGVPVIDDCQSIAVCCDKIECFQRFSHADVPIPATLVLPPPWQLEQAAAAFGYPVVFKVPDSCASQGVFRATCEAELFNTESQLLRLTKGPVVAQEFIATEFDWRVGVLGGQPLFCCQYRMAPHHWQIIKRFPKGNKRCGSSLTLKPHEYPEDVIDLALRATACVGDGLYGVDIKASDKGLLVMEVNDNPSIDGGYEDKYVNVWQHILDHLYNLAEHNVENNSVEERSLDHQGP